MVIGFKRAVALALGVLLAGTAQAQDNAQASAPANPQTNATVGSPLLRDFDLPGTRTTPPAEQAPVVQAQPPAQPQQQVPAPQQQQPVQRAAPPRAAPAPQAQAPAGPAPAAAEPTLLPDAAPIDFGAAAEPATLPEPQSEPITSLPEPGAGGTNWLWPALGGAVALLLIGLALARRRRSLAYEAPGPAQRDVPPPPAPAPRPVPAPAPVPASAGGAVTTDLRPWLEIEFKPERLVTTGAEATLHFELLVKNVGKSPARGVRIQARMFNPSASQQQEIAAFFAAPMVGEGEALAVPPQLAARFKSSVTLPREHLRPVEIGGRALFIPTVAINMSYEFGNGRRGQTSRSYVVGTERAEQAEKMGPFRLDLGPRIYRQVGGRALDLARAV